MPGVSNWIVRAIASFGFLGYAPIVPATFGTLGGVALALLLRQVSLALYSFIIVAVFALAVFISGKAEKIFGRKDSPRIVIDEVIGFLIASFALPTKLPVILAAFILFRIFDILKPYPAKKLAQKQGGWGVVLDDVVAGLYTVVLMQILQSFGAFG